MVTKKDKIFNTSVQDKTKKCSQSIQRKLKKSSKRHKIKPEWKNTSFSEIAGFNVKKMPALSQLI